MSQDYSKLSDDDLRRAVAERRGWTNITHPPGHPMTGRHATSASWDVPEYSTSIADAWALVDDARDRGYMIAVGGRNADWNCLIRGDGNFLAFEMSGAAPRAICLAWLMMMNSLAARESGEGKS